VTGCVQAVFGHLQPQLDDPLAHRVRGCRRVRRGPPRPSLDGACRYIPCCRNWALAGLHVWLNEGLIR
jgi:hypothetical protein